MIPHLETDRLFLRPRGIADLADCLAMDREPEVTRFVSGPWDDPVRHEDFVRSRIGTDFGAGLGYWSIFPKAEPQRFAGWVLLIPENARGPEVEIGWRLTRASWGQGFGTEAARAVLEHAARLHLPRVIAVIDAENHASCRIAEKIGMLPEGQVHDGRRHLHYVLTRPT